MDIVADFACQTGECPVWNPLEQALYWADIPRGRMFRYDPASAFSELVFEGGQIGALVVQEDGSILQFLEEGLVQVWRDGKTKIVREGIPAEKGNRFNDAEADALGRVLAGTMPDEAGKARLYRFDPGGKMEMLLDDVGQSNGMAFDHAGLSIYHTDTKRKTIRRYDYDLRSGHLGCTEVIVKVEEVGVVPDGLKMDSEGALLSAHWGGSCIVRYSATGTVLGTLEVPTPQVSSLAFGGRAFADIYITTAGGNEREKYGPGAGALFRTRAEVPGNPPRLARLSLAQA